jgi:hypothetical protein
MSTHKSSTHSHSHSQPTPVGRFEAAYTKTAKARAALEPAELWSINLDVQLAVTTVLSARPRMDSLRAAIEAQLPAFELSKFDHLETYAESLAYAQTSYLAAAEPAEALPALVARAAEVRDQLVGDATALARRGLIDARALSELKGGNGFLNVGSDVGVLVRMLRERWSDIQGKSAIQIEELDEAEQLFERITLGYAERSQQPVRAAAAADHRTRAYSLLVAAYDQARRAISYVRWEENDVDKFAPSLWSGRGGRGSAKTAPADHGAGVDGSKPRPADGAAPAAPAPAIPPPAIPATPASPGMPGGSPFANG